jgi:hypothetical protein
LIAAVVGCASDPIILTAPAVSTRVPVIESKALVEWPMEVTLRTCQNDALAAPECAGGDAGSGLVDRAICAALVKNRARYLRDVTITWSGGECVEVKGVAFP